MTVRPQFSGVVIGAVEGQPLRTATCRDTSRRYMQANTANPVKRLYCHYIGAGEAPQRQGCIVLSRWNQCAAAKKNCPTLMLALKHASSNHNRCGHYGLLPRAVQAQGAVGQYLVRCRSPRHSSSSQSLQILVSLWGLTSARLLGVRAGARLAGRAAGRAWTGGR